MWLRNKILLAACLLLVSACGFTPMYAQKSDSHEVTPAGQRLTHITVAASAPDITQRHVVEQFKAELQDRLNPDGSLPLSPEYRLEAALLITEGGVGVSRDGTVSRYNVYVQATLNLIRLKDGANVFTGRAQRVSSYNNVTNAYYSTHTARADALKRATAGLSEDVQARLAALFAENPNPQPKPKPKQPLKPQKKIPIPPATYQQRYDMHR